jgi:hypothetical protein
MATASVASDSPVVQGMLRMMEDFGFIDRDRLPMGVPYLPSASAMSPYGFSAMPGLGNMPGTGPLPGMTGIPGASGLGPMGSPMPGMGQSLGAWPGVPWSQTQPGAGLGSPWSPSAATPVAGLLDGIWELNTGDVVVIRADAARLYVSRDQYQDYLIRYDDTHFWWRPRDGSKFERYRYEMREGRMVLADRDGNLLLLRRRR